MNKLKSLFILLIPMTILSVSCVSQKKYDELLAQKNTTTDNLSECNTKLHKLKEEHTQLNQSYDQKSNEYEDLLKKHNQVLSKSGNLTKDLMEKQLKIQELQQILDDKEKAVKLLKEKVSNALLNFTENDLSVEIKDGKVYVSLAAKLLFASGSIDVDPQGVEALKQLASVLEQQNDIDVMVEGHTDNVPVSNISKYMKDNWDLSVMRATAIVRILLSEGVLPSKISAAGRSEFNPIVGNDTPEGKQKNRRIEVILIPQLDELYQLLENAN